MKLLQIYVAPAWTSTMVLDLMDESVASKAKDLTLAFPPKKWTYGQISENGVPKFKHGHSWKRSRHLASNFLRSSVSSTTGSSSSSSPSISVSPSSILHWQGDLLKAPSTQPEPNLLSTIVCAENDAARQVLFCVFCTSV